MSRQTPANVVRFLVLVVVVAATLAGCGSTSTASPPAAASATAGVPSGKPPAAASGSSEVEQLVAQAMSAPIDVSDPGPRLDRAEQGMKDYMRAASGVAELLGPNGADTLGAIDAAERQAVAALIAKLRAQAALPRGGVRLASVVTHAPPDGSVWDPNVDGGESLLGAFIFTMMAPELYAGASRNASGNLDRQTLTQEGTTDDGSTIRLTLQPSLAGSKLNADVKVTITVPGPPAYTEEATGSLSVDLCPDANGNVPLGLSLGGGYSLRGGGMQYHVAVTATGHTDDSGKLASMDIQTDGSLASQPQTGQSGPGAAPIYVELRTGFSTGVAGGDATNATASVPRYSSQIDEAFVRSTISITVGMGTVATVLGFGSAERQWTTGYCLAIAVPEITGSSKQVDPGSETPFTAVVSHKFETAELHVPVMATLASGTVSVTPSGTKVPSPASFRYTAPGEIDRTAAILLEARSKRGIATLNVELRTGLSAYRASWQDRNVTWSGVACGLERPFTITVVSVNAAGGADLTMLFEFAPSGPAGGTVSFDVTKYGTHWQGAGPYEVKAADTGQLSLVGQIRGSYTASGQTGYYPIPFNVPLTPLTTNECAGHQ